MPLFHETLQLYYDLAGMHSVSSFTEYRPKHSSSYIAHAMIFTLYQKVLLHIIPKGSYWIMLPFPFEKGNAYVIVVVVVVVVVVIVVVVVLVAATTTVVVIIVV